MFMSLKSSQQWNLVFLALTQAITPPGNPGYHWLQSFCHAGEPDECVDSPWGSVTQLMVKKAGLRIRLNIDLNPASDGLTVTCVRARACVHVYTNARGCALLR